MMVVHQYSLPADLIHADKAPFETMRVSFRPIKLVYSDLDHVAPAYDEFLMTDQDRLHLGILYQYKKRCLDILRAAGVKL